VSKKTRPRRSGPSNKAPSSKAPAKQATAPVSGGTPIAPGRGQAEAIVERVLASLWTAIEAGDPLRAELETATCMAIPRVAGQRDPKDTETFVSTVLVDGAVGKQTPEAAALLRLLMSLGSAGTKKTASRALAELTGAGIYPPDWVTEIGKVVPGQAWRRYDVFGDDEAVAATFSYGEAEHAIAVQVDLTGIPMATAIGVSSKVASLIEAMSSGDDPFDRPEQISLTDARRRIEEPLARCEQEPDQRLAADTVAYLPIARNRVRRLPDGLPDTVEFSAEDRAAAVDEFMKSPLAADAVAGDEASTRFWAEVLTGYSSRIGGEPPAQVGPRKLVHIFLGHVVNSFTLTPAQRHHLESAVTAWTRWSAAYRDLDEAQTARLLEELPKIFSRFDEAYDDPESAAVRAYVSDLATSDADISWLSRNMGRRMFALPIPEHHDGHDQPDVTSPAGRRALAEAEFGECVPPAGLTSEQFVDAAHGIIEELWQEKFVSTFLTASHLFAEGIPRHDVIHQLAGSPPPTRGESMIREGFTDHSMSS
jgi:hypothetical protein